MYFVLYLYVVLSCHWDSIYIATEANHLGCVEIRSGARYETLISRDIGVYVLF